MGATNTTLEILKYVSVIAYCMVIAVGHSENKLKFTLANILRRVCSTSHVYEYE